MKALRIGIFALVTFTVLAHGAVEGWAESVLEIGAATLFAAWGVLVFRGRLVHCRGNPLLWPLGALAGLALLQWLTRQTASPYLTKVEFLRLAAYFLVFFLAVQVFRTAEEWRGFAWFLLVLGFSVSVFGILQHFTFNGKLYWFRELRFGGIPFGPYVNRNHFSGLMELLIPSGLALLVLRAGRRDQLPLIALFTLLPIGALFLAASRGGIASFFVQIAVLGILIWGNRGKSKGTADASALLAAGAVLLSAVAVVAWLGVGSALDRFARFQSLEVSEARRLVIMKDSWNIFRDHPWLGTGLGTLIVVYPRYETFYDGKMVNHAHNDYVEVLAEGGVAGGACCLTFIVLLFGVTLTKLRSRRAPVEQALRIGALAACAGLLVHGLVDFNFHIPSNALLFLLQGALASADLPAPSKTGFL